MDRLHIVAHGLDFSIFDVICFENLVPFELHWVSVYTVGYCGCGEVSYHLDGGYVVRLDAIHDHRSLNLPLGN